MQETDPLLAGAPTIYAAPLQSYTTVFYRQAYHQTFGGIDKYFTPFFEEGKKGGFTPKMRFELDAKLNEGTVLVPQILTNKPDFLVLFAQTVSELGYNEINLNMGCPHPPIWRKGLGCGLLQNPQAVDDMLNSFFKQTPHIKLSVKMRLGLTDADEWQKLTPVLNNYPLHEVIVHPRTAKQLYAGTPHWEQFGEAAKAINHSIVANGNVDSLADYIRLKTQFPTISKWMLGRGWLRNPWLPQIIQSQGQILEGNMEMIRTLYQNFHNLVFSNVDDINVKRNLLHDFWHFPCESIEKGIKWRRSLAKKTSLASYPTMVGELLLRDWKGPTPNIAEEQEPEIG